jgi:sugar (pentulose or hexulose) kinase
MTARFVAVFDVGKTNAKVVVHDLDERRDVFEARQPNRTVPGPPYPHYDVDSLWTFLLASLAAAAGSQQVDAIVVTCHGASIVLMEGDRLATPILDYEHPLPETEAAYSALRPPFEETLSPPLPHGLNVGAQLYWLEQVHPKAFARTTTITTYPGYWGVRLTGVHGADVTSFGSHTEIWNPTAGTPSSLARSRGWADRLPRIGTPFELLGGLLPEVADTTGLPAGLPVHYGIHDSNASLLPHLLARPAPFSVVSTGTWAVIFAIGAASPRLDPDRDTLANIDAFGRPTPSARYMAGREFDIMTAGRPVTPSPAELRAVIDRRIMGLPTFVPGSGPFMHDKGRWIVDPNTLGEGERTAAASLYSALVTDTALGLIGAAGPTIVEGPFAANRVYADALAALTGRPVTRAAGSTGTSAGAALLAAGPDAQRPLPPEAPAGEPVDLTGLDDYAREWRAAIGTG